MTLPDPSSGRDDRRGGFNLSAWALEHKSFTGYLVVAFLLAGLAAYGKLGQKEDPEFTFRGMVVRTVWPGATAREMELQITDKIEKKLQETPYLDNLRSYSRAGESTIFVNLAESTPPREVAGIWYQVRKRVADIRGTLPVEVHGPFFNDEFGDTFGSIFAFSADGYSYSELKRYVDRARQDLLRLPGVAKVDLLGVQDEKVYIEYSNAKIAQLGLDPQVFAATVQQQNAKESSGMVVTPTDNVLLRVTSDFDSLDAIRNVSIRASNKSFRLGDIVEVHRGYLDPPELKMRFQGKEVIGLAISMTRDGDVIELGKALQEAIRGLRAKFPVGIEIHQVSDQPAVVGRSVNEFMRTLGEAVVIVIGVSLLSLGIRAGMVVALTIPLVLGMTFLLMLVAGIDLQRISLGALIIALGLLVDDAMIAVEMMMRKMEEGYDKLRAASFAYQSTAFPMLTGTLITATGFLPIGTAKSAAGEYTFSIFAVVGIALIVSWVAAVVFTPFIGAALLKSGVHGETEAYNSGFYRRFRAFVSWCLDQRFLVIAITVAIFALSIYGFRYVDKQFFPSANRPELMVDLWLAEGSSFAHTEAQAIKLEKKLLGDPDVANIVTYVGGGSPRFYLPLDAQLNNLNFAQMVVMAKGLPERERLRAKLKGLFKTDFPEVRGRVTPLENGPPTGYPVQFRVVGPEPERLRVLAQDVALVMAGNPHVRDVNLDWNERIKVMELDIDQDKARALGLTSLTISRSLRTAVSGQVVGQFREGEKLIDIVARARPAERNLVSAVQDLSIHTQNGRFVPVSQIAKVTQKFEEPIVWRRNHYPAITVRADIADGVQAPDITQQIDPLLGKIREKLPDGYRLEVAGTQESSSTAEDSIAAGMPLMLFIIFTLLIMQMQSVSRAILVFLTAPLGLIGVAMALLLFQVPFGFVAQLGVIALGGMIMRNSVILIDQIEQDIRDGADAWTATIEATVRRLRPIVLTAAAAVLAMIPLTRSVFWGPMAVAIMGGLIVATLLTLVFLPALYAALFRVRRPSAPPLA